MLENDRKRHIYLTLKFVSDASYPLEKNPDVNVLDP